MSIISNFNPTITFTAACQASPRFGNNTDLKGGDFLIQQNAGTQNKTPHDRLMLHELKEDIQNMSPAEKKDFAQWLKEKFNKLSPLKQRIINTLLPAGGMTALLTQVEDALAQTAGSSPGAISGTLLFALMVFALVGGVGSVVALTWLRDTYKNWQAWRKDPGDGGYYHLEPP